MGGVRVCVVVAALLVCASAVKDDSYDCMKFEVDCLRLVCQSGSMQRTRVGSCERCACVREEANCTLLRQECEGLKCLYELARTLDADGCERCVCQKPPCETKRCPAGERCVSAPFRDPYTSKIRHAADCKPVLVAASIADVENATVTGQLGQPLAVQCRAHGYPPPVVRWYRGDRTSSDMILHSSLYETHGTDLHILRLHIDILGEYTCRAYNGIGSVASKQVVVRAYRPQNPFLIDYEETQTTRPTALAYTGSPTTSREPETLPFAGKTYDCMKFEVDCLRLVCQSGSMQRTRVGSCERCACVREEANCTLLRQECEALECLYGLARTLNADGCERCVCLMPPCATNKCPAGERCTSALYRDPDSSMIRYAANCKPVSKAGACPAAGEPVARSTESACRQECADDADCRGVLKCCARGCSQLCLPPLPPAPPTAPRPSTTHTPEITIPANCVDTSNCAVIVQRRFCVHKYYSQFCCKSCLEAGQLSLSDVLLKQSDQTFHRK